MSLQCKRCGVLDEELTLRLPGYSIPLGDVHTAYHHQWPDLEGAVAKGACTICTDCLAYFNGHFEFAKEREGGADHFTVSWCTFGGLTPDFETIWIREDEWKTFVEAFRESE